MKQYTVFTLTLILITLALLPAIHAQEESTQDIKLFGTDIEEFISFASAVLALFLAVVTFIAYRRDGRQRLLYVSIAFSLFALKNLLDSSELVFGEILWFGPLATVLEFIILICFFYAVVQK